MALKVTPLLCSFCSCFSTVVVPMYTQAEKEKTQTEHETILSHDLLTALQPATGTGLIDVYSVRPGIASRGAFPLGRQDRHPPSAGVLARLGHVHPWRESVLSHNLARERGGTPLIARTPAPLCKRGKTRPQHEAATRGAIADSFALFHRRFPVFAQSPVVAKRKLGLRSFSVDAQGVARARQKGCMTPTKRCVA